MEDLFLDDKFLFIFENLPDMISLLNPDMTIRFINKKMANYFNVEPEDVVGKKCYEIIHNTKFPPEFCPVNFFLKNKKVKEVSFFHDGLKRHVWVSISPLFDKDKNLQGFIHVARDITDYKSIEEALRKEKYEKNLILDSSPSQISFLDTELNVIWANRLYIENSFFSSKEVFSKKCYEIWHKRTKPCNRCPAIEAMGRKSIVSRKLTDYKGRWWLITANPVLNERGEVIGAVTNSIEITELERLKKRSKISEERFKKFTYMAPVGILVYKDDRCIYANPYVYRICGYSLKNLKEMNLWDLVPSEQRDAIKRLGKEIQEKRFEIRDLEVPIITKKGRKKWVYISATPIELEEGRAVLVTGIDITEKKELEKKLEESLKDFEDLSVNIPDSIIWKVDLDIESMKIKNMFVSPSIEEVWGISRDVFNRKDLWERYLPKEDLIRLKEFWNKIYSLKYPKKTFGIEHRIVTEKKGVLWLYSRISIRTIGKIMRIVGYTGDVTKRKVMEERISKSEKEYRAIFESVKDGIVILKDCKVVKCNKNFLKMIGLNLEDDIVGKNFWEIFTNGTSITTELKEKITNFVENNLVLDKTYTFEGPFINFDGNKMYVEVSITPYSLGKERYILALVRDITARKIAEEKMRYLSLHDSLTGIYNRNFFETEMERYNNQRFYPITIIVADIDGLKLINDSMGHKKGDELIKKSAEILKNSLRSSDVLARMGGDEFAILLPHTDCTTAEKIKNRILFKLEEHNNNHPELPVYLSIGMATAKNNKIDLESLYKQADDIMYWNKLLYGKKVKLKMLKSFFKALEDRDYINGNHVKKIARLCKKLAKSIGLSRYEIRKLILLAFFHDLGKIGIPDDILFKKGKLTSAEWDVVKKHSEIGYKIATNIPKISELRDLILKHHERWNGSGYPLGLKKEEIPIECRIFQICEAFDVMTRRTPYRAPLSIDEAKQELLDKAGSQFDPYLVKKFLELHPEEILVKTDST